MSQTILNFTGPVTMSEIYAQYQRLAKAEAALQLFLVDVELTV